MKLIITVDVEADNQWKRSEEITLENIKFLPRFQELCQKYRFKPTYFITYEVAVDRESVNILKPFQDSGSAEVGAHLHPWTTPPCVKDREWEMLKHRFPNELEDEELYKKLSSLTKAIAENFGISPKTHRAGRWGYDIRIMRFLNKLGYIADSSVTPKISWKNNSSGGHDRRGPDFRGSSLMPSVVDGVLEVPMTVAFTSPFVGEASYISRSFALLPDSLLKKVLNKLFFKQRWLRIFSNSSFDEIRSVLEALLRQNFPVAVFMVHSSELMIGGSPYVKNEQELEHFYDLFEKMLIFSKKKSIISSTLKEYAKGFIKKSV
ncbi:MAG: hypothetical protein PHW53_00185 [Patescibacteria group bacterium]|nr:hypothetical protein [Patescibacteria group bacterium]